MALDVIAPVDLLSQVEISPVVVGQCVRQRRYARRLQGLLDAQRALEIAEQAYAGVDEDALATGLSQLLSLWHPPGQFEALQSVRNALTDIAGRLEAWQEELDCEREALCSEVLGVSVGDAVSIAGPEGRCTLLLERMSVHVNGDPSEVCFYLQGRRYRKDGLPGKRQEFKAITVPWRGSPGSGV